MRVAQIIVKVLGLGLMVGFDLVRPSRAEFRMPARWLAR